MHRKFENYLSKNPTLTRYLKVYFNTNTKSQHYFDTLLGSLKNKQTNKPGALTKKDSISPNLMVLTNFHGKIIISGRKTNGNSIFPFPQTTNPNKEPFLLLYRWFAHSWETAIGALNLHSDQSRPAWPRSPGPLELASIFSVPRALRHLGFLRPQCENHSRGTDQHFVFLPKDGQDLGGLSLGTLKWLGLKCWPNKKAATEIIDLFHRLWESQWTAHRRVTGLSSTRDQNPKRNPKG